MKIKDPHTLICKSRNAAGQRVRREYRFETARECSRAMYELTRPDKQIIYGGQIVHEEEAPPDVAARWQEVERAWKGK